MKRAGGGEWDQAAADAPSKKMWEWAAADGGQKRTPAEGERCARPETAVEGKETAAEVR
jgi:hypothetical protein